MKSEKLQLWVTLAAVLTTAAIFAAKGLPPSAGIQRSAYDGDVNGVCRALNWGVAVNAKRLHTNTPLHCAANGDSKEVMDLLIAHGAEDRLCLEQDAREFAEREVAQANDWAARNVDGRNYIQTDEREWVVFFVPRGTPRSREPPAGAIRHSWTDRYALAIERHYRYSIEEFGKLGEFSDPPHEMLVTLKVAGRDHIRRLAMIEPVPTPPEGMELWQDTRSWGRGGGGEGRMQFGGGLPGVQPFGQESSMVTDPIARKVLEESVPVEEQPISARLVCPVRYNPKRKAWHIEVYSVRLDHEPRLEVKDRTEPGVYSARSFPVSGNK